MAAIRNFRFLKGSYSDELINEMKGSSEYEAQAIDFLKDNKVNLTIVFSHKGKHFPTDKQQRNIYRVILETERGSYEFNFGDSINNTEKGAGVPKAYDILACLNVYEVDDFANFCMEFGYELNTAEQIRQAQKTHLAVAEESRALRRLFTSEQLEQLSEIQ